MRKTVILFMLIIIVAMSLTPVLAYAGGDKNTLRGSEGEQIGDPTPDPEQEPDQPRIGDPNPNMDNVPDKDDN